MKLGSVVIIGLALWTSPVLAAPACTQRTTTGSWVFKCEGELPLGTPMRSLGSCEASGQAYWRCAGQVNSGGVILQQEVEGQAINHADCTGTIVYDQKINGQPAPQIEINYVILDHGSTLWGLPLSSGGVLACVLQRIDRGTR